MGRDFVSLMPVELCCFALSICHHHGTAGTGMACAMSQGKAERAVLRGCDGSWHIRAGLFSCPCPCSQGCGGASSEGCDGKGGMAVVRSRPALRGLWWEEDAGLFV